MFWKCYLISYSKQNKQGQGAGCQDAQIAPGPPSLYQNIDNDRTHLHSRPCRPSGRCGVGHGAINCKTINDISPLASKLSILIQFVLYSCWLGADIQFGSAFDFNFDWKCVWKWIRSNSFLSFCPRWQNVTMMFYSEKWMIVTKRRSVQRSALGGGRSGGELFHFPAWRNVAVTSWGQATVVLTIHWSPLNGAELHNSDTIAILQIHSKIQYLQLSPTAQHPASPAEPADTFLSRPQNPLLNDIL